MPDQTSDTTEQATAQTSADNVMTTAARARRVRLVVVCGALFMLALGVRLFYWQDNRQGFVFTGMAEEYKVHAQVLYEGDVRRFLRGDDPPSDANFVKHPPGYPIFEAAVWKLFGHSDRSLRAAHVALDATACLLIFFIALELFPFAVAFIAGLLVALSPQLAYHGITLVPDPLAPLPLLVATWLLIRALKRPRLSLFIWAGALIGISCWFRSNALLLPPLLAALCWFLFARANRLRYALALLSAAILVMLPVTIRNYVAFHHFIPLSLSAGITLVEGISIYDKEKKFGLPDNDYNVTKWEAEMYQRPDYLGTRFKPDGVMRERARVARGLAVIRQHPFWFATVMLRRASDMLRFPRVELVAAEPAVTHPLMIASNIASTVMLAPADLAHGDTQAQATLTNDARALRLTGDHLSTIYITPTLNVQPSTDYLLRLPLKIEQGSLIVDVLDAQTGALLASTPIQHPINYLDLTPDTQPAVPVLRPFVSSDASAVRVRLRNGDRRSARVVAEVGAVEAFSLGAATETWTRYPRLLLRFIQKFFLTAVMLPLAILGAVLMFRAGQRRELLILLALPFYYMSVQSILWSEFRYVIAMHYALLVLAALALYWLGLSLWQQAQRLKS